MLSTNLPSTTECFANAFQSCSLVKFTGFASKLYAQIIGPVNVGNGARIAANAVVVKDVPENATMVGIPAKAVKLENKGNFRPYGVDDKVKDE